MKPDERQKHMRQLQKDCAEQPTWILSFSRRSRRLTEHVNVAGQNKQRLPVTPAIWVIIWTSVMVGYAGGYSDGASLLSHTTKPYRQLFFPDASEAATLQAARRQQQLYLSGHPEARLSAHHFNGIAWDIPCQQHFTPPALVLTWQFAANIVILPFAAWQARIYGRKAAVITGCCLQAVGIVLKALSWHLAQLAIGYFMEGLGRGILWLAIAIEDAEIAPASFRGGFICSNLVGTALGFLSAVAVFWEPRLQQADYGWRVATALNALPATVVVLLLPWFSESPNSLIQRGKLAEGREALTLIRGPFYDPTQELMDIVKGAGTEPFASSSGHGDRSRTATRARSQGIASGRVNAMPGSSNGSAVVKASQGGVVGATADWATQQQQHVCLQDNPDDIAAAMADGVSLPPSASNHIPAATAARAAAAGVRRETAAWLKVQVMAFKQRQHLVPLLVSCMLSLLLAIIGLAVEFSLLNLLVGDWMFGPNKLFYTAMFVTAGTQAAGALAAMCTIDLVGRRRLLATSSLLGATCWAALAALAAAGQVDSGWSTLPSAASVITLFTLIMFAHFLGAFMMLPVLATELHQLAVRTSAAAVVLLLAFCTRIMVINSVPYSMCLLQWRLFVLMAVTHAGLLVIVLLFMPETKGAPLEGIGRVWQKHWFWKRWIMPAAAAPDVA